MSSSDDLRSVAESIGNFIEYWGFRNIHGRIWALAFLAPEPITTEEIMDRLDVSKGLVSRAISELIEHKLLIVEGTCGFGRRKYIASEDVGSVVHDVLRQREQVLLEETSRNIERLADYSSEDLLMVGVGAKKLAQLKGLTKENESLLKAFLKKRFKTMAEWTKFTKRARGFLKL